ncbi:hypothetical protein N2152v2_010039 [Parachlorella kessleri]
MCQARSYSEVAALLRAVGEARIVPLATLGAAFDRLRALHAHSGEDSRRHLLAAFKLALEELMLQLPDADLRSLASLARTAFQLRVRVDQYDQQRIMSRFISLVTALQDRHAAKPEPPPPNPGSVRIKLSKQEAGPATGTGVAAASVASSSSGAGQTFPMQPGVLLGMALQEEDSQSVSEFVWAVLSNKRWQLSSGELEALMDTTPFTPSIGRLQLLRVPPATVFALFGQALADLKRKAPGSTNDVDKGARLHSISLVFLSLASVFAPSPCECRAALELPAARDLAQEFASGVEGPEDHRAWVRMLTACCQLEFNPPVDSQQTSLRVSLLKHLPAMTARFSMYDDFEVLAALKRAYWLDDNAAWVVETKPNQELFGTSRLPAELEPYQKVLPGLAQGFGELLQLDKYALKAWRWRGLRSTKSFNWKWLLEPYA